MYGGDMESANLPINRFGHQMGFATGTISLWLEP